MSEPTQLTDGAEVLLRQVHPTHKKADGTLSAQAFCPTPRDKGMLSTMRGAVGAQEAYRRWTQDAQRHSLGSYGVSVDEVHAIEIVDPAAAPAPTLKLKALDDAGSIGVPDHASIDFTELPTPGKVKQAARKLLAAAMTRGSLHP